MAQKPKHESTVKDITYHFRVSPFEKDILDRMMRGDQWRDLCVLMSMRYLEIPGDFDFEKREKNLAGVNIQGLLESAKEKPGDQET